MSFEQQSSAQPTQDPSWNELLAANNSNSAGHSTESASLPSPSLATAAEVAPNLDQAARISRIDEVFGANDADRASRPTPTITYIDPALTDIGSAPETLPPAHLAAEAEELRRSLEVANLDDALSGLVTDEWSAPDRPSEPAPPARPSQPDSYDFTT